MGVNGQNGCVIIGICSWRAVEKDLSGKVMYYCVCGSCLALIPGRCVQVKESTTLFTRNRKAVWQTDCRWSNLQIEVGGGQKGRPEGKADIRQKID